MENIKDIRNNISIKTEFTSHSTNASTTDPLPLQGQIFQLSKEEMRP